MYLKRMNRNTNQTEMRIITHQQSLNGDKNKPRWKLSIIEKKKKIIQKITLTHTTNCIIQVKTT